MLAWHCQRFIYHVIIICCIGPKWRLLIVVNVMKTYFYFSIERHHITVTSIANYITVVSIAKIHH